MAAPRPASSPLTELPPVAAYALPNEQTIADAEEHSHRHAHRTTTGRLRFHIADVKAFLRGSTA
jgi:hypothetical protein